jgi:hypothetical protein
MNMSAITETEPGGEMVCIVDFEARPRDDNGQIVAGQRRAFSTGEHVRYLRHFFVDTPEDHPLGYMAVFEPLDSEDKRRYGATESYFVSLECWEGLRRYFASNLAML